MLEAVKIKSKPFKKKKTLRINLYIYLYNMMTYLQLSVIIPLHVYTGNYIGRWCAGSATLLTQNIF